MSYEISSGQVSSGITLYGHDMYVYSGGVANCTTVDGGNLHVSNGGAANETTMHNGCTYVSSGGTANSTTLNYSGWLYVSSGGTANSTTVNGGELCISSGGTANSTTVSRGRLYVSSGGTATAIKENGGYVEVYDGASATFVANSFSGLVLGYSATLHSGTTANSTTVSGYLYVSSGGVANSNTLNVGYLYVSSGGTANETTVNSRGNLYVCSGGTANSITLNDRGSIFISSGGTALNVAWTPCIGHVTIEDGALVTFASSYTGVYYGDNLGLWSSALTMTGKTLYGNLMYVMNNGTANSTTVFISGYLYISSGGTANDTVNGGGFLYVSSGGIANYTNVTVCYYQGLRYNGYMYVCGGGTANSTTVNSYGWMDVYSGGVANSTTVNSGGRLYVSSGGTATAIKENGGYVDAADGANATFVANSFNGLLLSSVSATLHSGTTANYTTVRYYGDLYICSGGAANDTIVGWRGNMYVSSGGTANSTDIKEGWMNVSSGGTANATTVNSGGSLFVSSGGTALNVAWTPCIGQVAIEDGATVTFADVHIGVYLGYYDSLLSSAPTMSGQTLSGHSMYVMNSGAANSTLIYTNGWNDNGHLYVCSGGTANHTDVCRGYMHVYSGATANSTTVDVHGSMYVCAGGTANDTTAIGGYLYVSSGGAANSTTVNGGYLYVSNGGVANSTTVNSYGYLFVSSGGTANSTKVNSGGSLYVSSGGTATIAFTPWQGTISSAAGAEVTYLKRDAKVYYADGSGGAGSGDVVSGLTLSYGVSGLVFSGGTANNTTVNFGGCLYVSSGGKITGRLTIADDAAVSAYSGSIMDFDISHISAGGAALVNDLSRISGVPDFTVTVSATQTFGTYALAGGARSFDRSITVTTDAGMELGVLSVGGSLKYGDSTYTLIDEDGMLLLKFADQLPPDAPTARADVTTRTTGNVTVTATFSSDSAQKQYSLDNKTWQTYTSGVVMSKNGTVYFRGIDAAGNISAVTSYAVTNIIVTSWSNTVVSGLYAEFTPELAAAGLYTVTGNFGTMNGSVTIYDGAKKVASGSIKGGVLTFKKDALLEKKSTYTVKINNTDKKSAGATFSWTLKAKELFTKGDNTDDTKAKAKTLAAGTPANDWIGFGDAVDYYKLGVDAQGGFYDLSISGVRNNVKLTVYAADGRKVKGVTVSAKKPAAALANLCLANGSYAVVEAPKAAKAQNSEYKLQLTQKAVFTGAKNNDWAQAEVLAKGATFTGALTKAAGGDVVDYCDVSKIDSLSFDMTAGKTKVSFFDAQHNAVKTTVKLANGADKTAASLTLAAGNAATDHFNLAAIDNAVKYLKIEAAGKTLNGYTITKIA